MAKLNEGVSHQKAIQPNVWSEILGHTNWPLGSVLD